MGGGAGGGAVRGARRRGRSAMQHASECNQRSSSSNGQDSHSTPSAAGAHCTDSTSWSHRRRRFPKLRAVRVEVRLLGGSSSSSTDDSSTGRVSAVVIRLSSSSCSRWRPPTACIVNRSSISCGRTHRLASVANRLHKAAHFVRKATEATGSIVISAGSGRRSSPAQICQTDVEVFDRLAADALSTGDAPGPRSSAATCIAGELLPLRSL